VQVRVEYRRPMASVAMRAGVVLKWSRSGSADNASSISQQALFASSAIGSSAASPRLMHVEPNVACAAASHVSGMALTLATAGVSASFRVIIRDQYGNARANGGHQLVARLVSAVCQTSADCMQVGPQVGSSAASSGNAVAGGQRLSTHLTSNVTNSSTSCNFSRGKLQLHAALDNEERVAAAGIEAGKWVIFTKGACAGRWTRIESVNASAACLHLSPVWADALPPCMLSHSAAAAPSNLEMSYIIAAAPWARAAHPPLECKSCPRVGHPPTPPTPRPTPRHRDQKEAVEAGACLRMLLS
jgi:hypothetical protein